MKVGTLLLILHDVIEKLVGMNILSTSGDFINPTVGQDVQIATMIEQAAKAHGVVIQSDVDKILNILPLVMSLVGVK